MHKLVLVRHGESVWNKENRFTGWTDVELTEKGAAEALEGAKLLKEGGYTFDVAYTSVLKRAIKTLWIVLEEMDLMWIPVYRDWRLNERHYGGLQGLNKSETAEKFGDEQILIWRRSYSTPPPELTADDERFPGHDPQYLKDTVERFLPYYTDVIVPDIKAGKNVLIAAHGNSLRALVKYLDNVSEEEIVGLNIPTGVPLVYELNDDLTAQKSYYLGDQDKIAAAMQAVANQAKKK